MGLFSNSKRNSDVTHLIRSHGLRVAREIEGLPEKHPGRLFAFASSIAVSTLMTSLLFGNPKEKEETKAALQDFPFRKFAKQVSERQTHELFVLLTIRNLIVFLSDSNNIRWVENKFGPQDKVYPYFFELPVFQRRKSRLVAQRNGQFCSPLLLE